MPRPTRADEAGGLYQALKRGNSRAQIFHKEAAYEAFERIFAEGLERDDVQCFCSAGRTLLGRIDCPATGFGSHAPPPRPTTGAMLGRIRKQRVLAPLIYSPIRMTMKSKACGMIASMLAASLTWLSAGACGSAAENAAPKDDYTWIRGANYVPSYARNDVAIWMDYDPAVIDRELGYAARLKLNTVRVFLNQAVYELEPKLFSERWENFLSLCEQHKIQAMPVLFDSCFDPQTVDLKNYRDKNWIPGPGFSRLGEKDRPAMETFIRDVVGAHRTDRRIVMWDVMNEPESTAKYGDWKQGGRQTIDEFVRWSLRRVRQEAPVQPLTIGWAGAQGNIAAIDLVDVICVHHYCPSQELKQKIQEAKLWGRLYGKPVIMNEFVGRPQQPLEVAVPIAAEQKIGWVFWELMLGKTQFSQGRRPYQGHLYSDGTCYSAKEVAAVLCPEGYTGSAEDVAAKAGFKLSDKVAKGFAEEGLTFSPLWDRWNGEGPAKNRLWYAVDPQETAVKEVEGRSVALVLKYGPDCGVATVMVDGKPAAVPELDTYSRDVDWNRRVVVAENLSAGLHRVVLTVTGRKAAAASNRYVQLVDILGQP